MVGLPVVTRERAPNFEKCGLTLRIAVSVNPEVFRQMRAADGGSHESFGPGA